MTIEMQKRPAKFPPMIRLTTGMEALWTTPEQQIQRVLRDLEKTQIRVTPVVGRKSGSKTARTLRTKSQSQR